MRICEKCEFHLGDDTKTCPFCGGATHPAPEAPAPKEKPEQPFAVCNVCGFRLGADVKKCPFCGGSVAVKGTKKAAASAGEDKPMTEYQLLQKKAAELGLTVAANASKDKLKALIEETEKALNDKAELEKCSEEELRAAAASAGVELAADADKAVIIEKILAAAKDK